MSVIPPSPPKNYLPISRIYSKITIIHHFTCRGGGIGRHEGLKIPCSKGRAGSIPALGTTQKNSLNMEIGTIIHHKHLVL